uniref:PPM-type phosphatase domain-containing protein n=1 Tax=Heterorhabditis bacteriophora TaxID=37862 RepID=A0A1I7X561_HETBA
MSCGCIAALVNRHRKDDEIISVQLGMVELHLNHVSPLEGTTSITKSCGDLLDTALVLHYSTFRKEQCPIPVIRKASKDSKDKGYRIIAF